MRATDVRQTFLEFFAQRNHERVRSSALVPANDPTLLFTNAGMVQFKDVFTGAERRARLRATSSQKCVRAGGKHNDLDMVGRTARHHTFFEMLGNFSFGDYFKKEAIEWAWELLTDRFHIPAERLIVTVFAGDPALGLGLDEEARDLWKRVTGFDDRRVIALGTHENFWMMGETGPMGPCSEIHYRLDADDGRVPTASDPESAWDGWLEIWNLVFMQYERREAGGPLHPLPAPSIDTGAGLERVTAVLQGVSSNYDTDLFQPLIACAAEIAGLSYGDSPEHDTALRVIADHARATAFLIADGVFPDKNGREYVLRRILRRAVRHGKQLGIEEPFMHRICAEVVAQMVDAYPELQQRARVIEEITLEEEKRFRSTLDRGLSMLENEFERLRSTGENTISGAQIFQLYDTYGFPEDLTAVIAEEHGFVIDQSGFQAALDAARERSSFAGADVEVDNLYKTIAQEFSTTDFVGYGVPGTQGEGRVLALFCDGVRVERAEEPAEILFVCDSTPFYAESGGQVGDTGLALAADGARIEIHNTLKPAGDAHVHVGRIVSGRVGEGDVLDLQVDSGRRDRIRANHSATHLLNLGLRRVLGPHVAQKGSLVTPERLRFDFAHFSPLTSEQRTAVESWVNEEIRANRPTTTQELPLEEARTRGAVAMFGEKYGDTVRVVEIGSESLEFCGGTHVSRTGDIGLFKITGGSGIAQGVRRVEAVTGSGALDHVLSVEQALDRSADALRCAPVDVPERIDRLQGEHRTLRKEFEAIQAKLAAGGSRDLLAELREVRGIRVLATSTAVDDPKALRQTGDTLRDRIGSGVVVLIGVGADRVSLLAMVSRDLCKTVHAGKLLAEVAREVNGRGGGRPDMAQGGGTAVDRVPEALAQALAYIESAVPA